MAGGFGRQLARIAEGTAAGLYQAGNRIKNRSEELVPVDTGTLKSSARVLAPKVTAAGVEVVVGYGYGEAENPKTGERAVGYAVPVHERLDVVHPHGQPHFLLDAAREEIPRLGAEVAVAISRKSKVAGEIVDVTESVQAGEAP